MKFFKNLLPSKYAKRNNPNPFAQLICQKAKESGVVLQDNFSYLEAIAIKNLSNINKKKYDENLIKLWALLDMRKYLESYYEETVNPYIDYKIPIKDLNHYLNLPCKYQNLLDIKVIEKIKIEKLVFKKVYIATFEIKDEITNLYRPYVEFYTLSDLGVFEKIAYGYDTNDNKTVEMFLDNFNYAIFLDSNGFIKLPLKNKKIKLSVYNTITDSNIKELTSNIYLDDIEI